MKRGEFFTPCRDCIMHVGGGCAEGRGNTQDEDGCIVTYFYDCKLTDKMPIVPKRFVRYSAKVTPEILTAAGWKRRYENEAVVKMEKEIDEIYVNLDFRKRINKIDLSSDGIFHVRINVATVSQLNTLFEIVGLPQFKI